jgi:hypothetical protein
MIITVTGAKLLHHDVHSVAHFPWQQLTPFESRFDFLDRLNQPELFPRPKTLCRANWRRRFLRLLTSSHAPAGAQFSSVFSTTTDRTRVPFRFFFQSWFRKPKILRAILNLKAKGKDTEFESQRSSRIKSGECIGGACFYKQKFFTFLHRIAHKCTLCIL